MQDGDELAGQRPAVPTIQIANEVIGVVAGMAASQVEGVSGMTGGLASGLNDMLGRKPGNRGVRVDVDGREVDLALHLIVQYGARIPEVAQRVQEHVKQQVESTTGLTVRVVDIHIQGVAFQKPGESETPEGEEGQ